MPSPDASSGALTEARALLESVSGRGVLSDSELEAGSIRLAELLQTLAEQEKSESEAERARLLARMMDDKAGQLFTAGLTDRAHRTRDPEKIVQQARQLLDKYGAPEYVGALDRIQLAGLKGFGPIAPGLVSRLMVKRIAEESSQYVLSDDPTELAEHLARRRQEGVRVNVNHLGEDVVGEGTARRHLAYYKELLARPSVDTVSLKISSVYSQINLVAWDHSLAAIRERLREIYRTALAHPPEDATPDRPHKLVYLDMESFQDLHLTIAAFQQTLDEEEFLPLTAGMVLQAYIPDSFGMQQQLTEWARARVARGGAPIRVRIVKGANLGMERVRASLKGWAVPVYPSKVEVDANFKRMVEYACQPESAHAVSFGIASHNVFELAFGMLVRAASGVESRVDFELLEGMAPPLQRAVQQVAHNVLLYAPTVNETEFHSAVAYLVRRLDENTAEQNFLRHSFGMHVGDPAWDGQRAAFCAAMSLRASLSAEPRRKQDRSVPPEPLPADAEFKNEPDTDFSLDVNRAWLSEQIATVRAETPRLPLQVGGADVWCEPLTEGFDPSRTGETAYEYCAGTAKHVEAALATAESAASKWKSVAPAQRARLLRGIAQGLRQARGRLIATMMLDAGKRVLEADTEVSEAIDFAEFYARSMEALAADPSVHATPKGVVLVTPPWNFPLAIPIGGVMAALVAGNAVIFKPAPETVLTAYRAAQIAWAAGVPKDVLQFVPCPDEVGSRLVQDARVNAIVLTGASDTARLFHELRPGVDLMAETGGKNAIVVSALADREAGVRDIVQSAFGHAGQKCSACSLAICEAEVYDDAGFRAQLKDAVESLDVGSPWELQSFVTPLIQPPRGALLRGLEQLAPGEEWLVQPRIDADNPRIVSPGVKLGVKPGSFSHQTELFGPVLSVMRADSLEHALEIANGTQYGLTAGLHSLDEGEQAYFVENIRAGNVYVNRTITGAIVHRQPFGGMKRSSYGPGAKAGGPNYVAEMCHLTPGELPTASVELCTTTQRILAAGDQLLDQSDQKILVASAESYNLAAETHFRKLHITAALVGEDNFFGYVRCGRIALVASAQSSVLDVLRCVLGGHLGRSGLDMYWLGDADMPAALRELFRRVSRSEAELCSAVTRGNYERVRLLCATPEKLIQLAPKAGTHLIHAPVLTSGRFELLHYFREQSTSISYHRYGNLGDREVPVDDAGA